MQSNPPIILLDTNVWLELYLPERQNRRIVMELLALAEKQEASLVYPSHSALDVYQQVRKENKTWARSQGALTDAMARAIKRLAWDCVNDMQKHATAIPVDSSDLYLTCKFRDTHDDLEDDLVVAACQRSQANYLVTSDRRLLSRAPIKAVTPAKMLQMLNSGIVQGTPLPENKPDCLYEWLKTL